MEELKEFIITLATMIILISAVELIAPDNSMKKYLKFVLGLILIAVMITPVINIFTKDQDVVLTSIQDYLSIEENKSLEANETFENNGSGTQEIFKKNLEINCNRMLKEKFEKLDFVSNIQCNIDSENIEYSIEEIRVGVKDKGTRKIQKVVIDAKDENNENNIEDEKVENEDEVISYLMENFNVPKEKIVVYKIN
jgi:stage III sporulation protein AF